MGMLKKENCNKIEVMSFICACLVVFIHSSFYPTEKYSWGIYFIKNGIATTAVPFFFFISGFFLGFHVDEKCWYRKACKKRFFTLVIPYFIWNAVPPILGIAMTLAANITGHYPLTRNLSAISWNFGLFSLDMPALFPLWYIRTLIILVILSPAIILMMGKGKKQTLIACTVLFLISLIASDYLEKFTCFLPLSSILFFGLGISVSRNNFNWKPKHYVAFILFITGLALFVLKTLSYSGILSFAIYLFEIISFSAIILTGLGGYFLLPDRIKLPHALKKTSFGIYVLHIIFCFIFVWRIAKLMQSNNDYICFILFIITGLFLILLSIVTVKILNFISPKISSVLLGGR